MTIRWSGPREYHVAQNSPMRQSIAVNGHECHVVGCEVGYVGNDFIRNTISRRYTVDLPDELAWIAELPSPEAAVLLAGLRDVAVRWEP